MPVSREDLAAAIQAAIAKQTGGAAAGDAPLNPNGRTLPPVNPNDIQVAPPKPDPEAVANSQINSAANAPGLAGMYKPAPQPPMDPEQRARLDQQADKVEMMKRFYQNKANGGQ